MRRMQCITVLLLLVVSHSMIAAHAATHMQADVTECQLCSMYGDPSDAVPAERSSDTLAGSHQYGADFGDSADCAPSIINYRQRGPPLTI